MGKTLDISFCGLLFLSEEIPPFPKDETGLINIIIDEEAETIIPIECKSIRMADNAIAVQFISTTTFGREQIKKLIINNSGDAPEDVLLKEINSCPTFYIEEENK